MILGFRVGVRQPLRVLKESDHELSTVPPFPPVSFLCRLQMGMGGFIEEEIIEEVFY